MGESLVYFVHSGNLVRSNRAACLPSVFTRLSTGASFLLPFTGSEKDASEEHDLNWAFLKTSLLHYFTDMHPYQQAKAIVSIMNFNAQERKQIYAKLDEKYGRARSYYSYSRSSSSATS